MYLLLPNGTQTTTDDMDPTNIQTALVAAGSASFPSGGDDAYKKIYALNWIGGGVKRVIANRTT